MVRTILLGVVIVRGTAPKVGEGYLVCSLHQLRRVGRVSQTAQLRAISVILQADYAHLAGLSGKTGSCFTDNGSRIDAKF